MTVENDEHSDSLVRQAERKKRLEQSKHPSMEELMALKGAPDAP